MFRKPFLLVIGILVLTALACGAPARQHEQNGLSQMDGQKLFQSYGCKDCHSGNSNMAPTLAGIYGKDVTLESGETVTVDEAYLRESILDSKAKVVQGYKPIMPDFNGKIDEEQVKALIEYIRSLTK